MTDDPYKLDFFQKIVDCHWGSNWLYVEMAVITPSVIPPYETGLDFIGESGGTPGFVSIDGAVTGAITRPFGSPDKIITPADLARSYTLNGGLVVPALVVNFHNPGQNNPTLASFLVKMNRFNNIFRVRARRSVDPTFYDNVGVTIGTIEDKKVKAGLQFPSDIVNDLFDQATMGNVNATADFVVNGSTLDITEI